MRPNFTILLLENMDSDVFIFRRALGMLRFQGNVRVVATISEARDYMLNQGRFSDPYYNPRPDLIIADFGLSGERGTTFIQWLREQPDFKNIPVAMLSGSVPRQEIPAIVREFNVPIYSKESDFTSYSKTIQKMLDLSAPE